MIVGSTYVSDLGNEWTSVLLPEDAEIISIHYDSEQSVLSYTFSPEASAPSSSGWVPIKKYYLKAGIEDVENRGARPILVSNYSQLDAVVVWAQYAGLVLIKFSDPAIPGEYSVYEPPLNDLYIVPEVAP